MARVILLVTVLILATAIPPLFAQDGPNSLSPPSVLITEVLTGNTDDASQEFVELYNASDQPLASGELQLKLQYRSASGSSWLTRATLSGDLQPRGFYLIATPGFIDTTGQESTLGLAAAGGHLRLIGITDITETVYDQLAWGTAQAALIAPAVAPQPGQSLKRLVDEDSHFVDTDDDSQDFVISLSPRPENSASLELSDQEFVPSDGNIDDLQLAGVKSTKKDDKTAAKLALSELFIDPGKPLSDAEDEFVEIYNPTSETVDLEDYVIKTGASLNYRFSLPAIAIKPQQYLALFAVDTGLVLSNSGGRAQLIGPGGTVVDTTADYGPAKTDAAWALINGQWQWTDQPSPNEANLSSSTDDSGQLANNPGGQVLGATANGDSRTVYEDPPVSPPEPVNTAVVAGVGSMALLYAGYEYRFDLGNRIHQLKRYLKSRQKTGTKT